MVGFFSESVLFYSMPQAEYSQISQVRSNWMSTLHTGVTKLVCFQNAKEPLTKSYLATDSCLSSLPVPAGSFFTFQ